MPRVQTTFRRLELWLGEACSSVGYYILFPSTNRTKTFLLGILHNKTLQYGYKCDAEEYLDGAAHCCGQ